MALVAEYTRFTRLVFTTHGSLGFHTNSTHG
jgi:hypothetical protein